MSLPRPTDAGAPLPARPAGTGRAPDRSGPDVEDLLRVGALVCTTTAIALAHRRVDGTWAALAHGLTAPAVGDLDRLCSAATAAGEPREIPDLARAQGPGALVGPPLALRWAYVVPLGDRPWGGRAAATVLVLLDRSVRQLSGREKAGLRALSRQLIRILGTSDPLGPDRDDVRPSGRPAAGSPTGGAPGGAPVPIPAGAPAGELWRNRDVAALFKVTERTVSNWVATGRLPSLRTMGGHLRFRRDEILEAYAEHVGEAGGPAATPDPIPGPDPAPPGP